VQLGPRSQFSRAIFRLPPVFARPFFVCHNFSHDDIFHLWLAVSKDMSGMLEAINNDQPSVIVLASMCMYDVSLLPGHKPCYNTKWLAFVAAYLLFFNTLALITWVV